MAKKSQRNNFQDEAEDREYAKGFSAGKQSRNGSNKGKGKSGGKRYFQPKDSKPNVTTRIISNGNKGNDIKWHNPNQNMFDDVTGVTINAAVGLPILDYTPSAGSGSLGGISSANWTVYPDYNPGIMVSTFIPTLGVAKDGNSPVNKAMTKLFQYLRKDKSGSEIYQPADIGMVVGSLDSAYMYYTFCCKIYGMSRNVDIMNDYTPKALVEAHGVSWQSVDKNRADFKFWIDQFANDLSGFYIPKGLHLIDRHTYMTEKIFTDAESTKAQIYSFLPVGYWKFAEGTANAPWTTLNLQILIDTETMNAASANASKLLTVEQLMTFGNSLLKPLQDSKTVRNITADLLTAFSANGSYTVGEISNDYRVKPVYDKQALMMLENAKFLGPSQCFAGSYSQVISINDSYMSSSFSFTPSKGSTTDYPVEFSSPGSRMWNQLQPNRLVLNFHWDNVTKDDIMYATRLASFGLGTNVDEDGTGLDSMTFRTLGSEVMCDFTMTYLSYTNEWTSYSPVSTQIFRTQTFQFINCGIGADPVNASLFTNMIPILHMQTMLSKFDWHPQFRIVPYYRIGSATQSVVRILPAQYDMDVFGEITQEMLEQMNMVSLLGLLKIEEMKEYSY